LIREKSLDSFKKSDNLFNLDLLDPFLVTIQNVVIKALIKCHVPVVRMFVSTYKNKNSANTLYFRSEFFS